MRGTPARLALALITLLAGVSLAFLGCQSPQSSASSERDPRPAPASRALGDARLGAGDWNGALEAYREALTHEPENLAIRYRVAVALSNLDRPQDAAAAFAWVVEHGPADLEEVRIARTWLATASRTSGDGRPAEPAPAREATEARAEVRGATAWPGIDRRHPVRLRIALEGDEATTRSRHYEARPRLNEPYRIAGVLPGRYRLVAQVGGTRLWESTVIVQPGRVTTLDLTPSTAIAPPEALRPASPS